MRKSSLQLSFPVGTSIKKAGRDLHATKSAVEEAGFLWEHADMHEHEVNLLQRFLVDCSVSSGECLFLCLSKQAISSTHIK